MTYGARGCLEYLDQTKGGVAGQKVRVLTLDGRNHLDEGLKIHRRYADREQAVVAGASSAGLEAATIRQGGDRLLDRDGLNRKRP